MEMAKLKDDLELNNTSSEESSEESSESQDSRLKSRSEEGEVSDSKEDQEKLRSSVPTKLSLLSLDLFCNGDGNEHL